MGLGNKVLLYFHFGFLVQTNGHKKENLLAMCVCVFLCMCVTARVPA